MNLTEKQIGWLRWFGSEKQLSALTGVAGQLRNCADNEEQNEMLGLVGFIAGYPLDTDWTGFYRKVTEESYVKTDEI